MIRRSITVLVMTANHPNMMMPIYQYNRVLLSLLHRVCHHRDVCNPEYPHRYHLYSHFKGFWVESMQGTPPTRKWDECLTVG